jgi:hypothetical protein
MMIGYRQKGRTNTAMLFASQPPRRDRLPSAELRVQHSKTQEKAARDGEGKYAD